MFGSNFDGFGTGVGGFSVLKVNQHHYRFPDRCLKGFKMVRLRLASQIFAEALPLRTLEGILLGLQDWSPMVRSTRNREPGIVALDLLRRWPEAWRIRGDSTTICKATALKPVRAPVTNM